MVSGVDAQEIAKPGPDAEFSKGKRSAGPESLVQPLFMIFDRATDEFPDRIIDVLGERDDRLDLCIRDVLVGAKSHSAGDQDLAVHDVLRHCAMFPLRMFVEAMAGSMMLLLMVSPGEGVMSRFVATFAIRHSSVDYRKNFVVTGTSKMLADAGSVVSNERDFDVCGIHASNPSDSSLLFVFMN
jgi:hypothetical protein